jgi:arylsulfatase A-like enzyme
VRLVQEHAVYAGKVEAMDLAVGKVLAKLDELGPRENTIVIFTTTTEDCPPAADPPAPSREPTQSAAKKAKAQK